MNKVLVTGFKPFLGEKINPSELLCEKIENVEHLILPVEYQKSFEVLSSVVKNEPPEFLIMLGQASGRANICLEKIGLNWIQTRTADEAGFIPPVGMIDAKLPLAYLSTFPVDQIYYELKKKYPRLEISFCAGTFVCNQIYFKTLAEFPEVKSIFIHVPLLPEQLKQSDLRPSMSLQEMILFLNDLVDRLRRN